MPIPLVKQLQFARSEFQRCLHGVEAKDAETRLPPMNCISWMIGHLANQEQFYWSMMAQGKQVVPKLNDLVGYGKPASTPSLTEMWRAWQEITNTADTFLTTLSSAQLTTHLRWQGTSAAESIGTMLQRNIYHYWFHTGEAHAVRQLLGHGDLPQFVGDMSAYPYAASE